MVIRQAQEEAILAGEELLYVVEQMDALVERESRMMGEEPQLHQSFKLVERQQAREQALGETQLLGRSMV